MYVIVWRVNTEKGSGGGEGELQVSHCREREKEGEPFETFCAPVITEVMIHSNQCEVPPHKTLPPFFAIP